MTAGLRQPRQPGEWAKHAAIWTAWPHLADEWLTDLEPARAELVAMCRALAGPPGDLIRLVVPNESELAAARKAFADIPTEFYIHPFGDIWLRDTGPIFVRADTGALGAARFRFNGWGGKYLFDGDDTVGDAIIEDARVHAFRSPLVLEGGSIDVDGEGTCLTTRQCLLNPNRNPSLDQAALETVLRDSLGIERTIWLEEGLVNDHTDGHIDTIARFVAPGRVVCMLARDADDPNRDTLLRIRADLEQSIDVKGRKLEVAIVPSPGRVLDCNGRVMPASYANFIIGNATVVVPTYGRRWDDEAVRGVSALFPDRHTVGVPARAILAGGGAFHCITQQEPRRGQGHAG